MSKSADNLALLSAHKRKYLRARVTKYFTKLSGSPIIPENDRLFMIKTLQDIKADLLIVDREIQLVKVEKDDADEMAAEMEACAAYENQIRESMIVLQSHPDDESTSSTPVVPPRAGPSSGVLDSAHSLLKSPTAPLPRFNSEPGENLETFIRSFEETLSKFRYTDYDKLQLLKQQVSGKGTFLLDSLDSGNQTYSAAKELLTSAFASVDMQKFNIIKQMSDIKLNYDDEPFRYISEMRKIGQAVVSLGIDIDDVLRYFFFNGLNESFKSQLVQITNNIRPTLDEIFENYFAANERYLAAQSKFKDRKKSRNNYEFEKKSTVMAISAEKREFNNPFSICTMCHNDTKDFDHPINRCTKYVLSSEKLSKLKSIDACIKCGCGSHSTGSCRFQFKNKCKHCSGWHFSFLCANDSSHDKNYPRGKSTHSSVAITTSSYNSSSSAKAILTTFSYDVDGKKFRVFRDSGSQSNLITESALSSFSYKVLESNVILSVGGINIKQPYRSKAVLVDLKLGSVVHSVEFYTMPYIAIDTKLPGLSKIVKEFVDRNYDLADDFLLSGKDRINNIDLLLGVESAPYFKDDIYVAFGKNDTSVYMSTVMGIMLLGNIPKMITDLDFLPYYKGTDNYSMPKVSLCNPNYVSSTVSVANSSYCNNQIIPDNYVNSNCISEASFKLLESQCDLYLNKIDYIDDQNNSDQDNNLVQYLLDACDRKPDGRLIVPLLWNSKVSHLLANNYNIAKNILMSSKKKLARKPEHLELINQSLGELISIGAVEKINNFDNFSKEFPNHSFLAHMPIIKTNRESTKCRIVYLSNVCDKSEVNSISHNQAMLSGPCLNQKLSTALINLRFGKYLLVFDLVKAFIQLELSPSDQSKLLFFWFKNPLEGDFSLEVYKNVRLSFGLRCSPTILMVSLYKILIVDAVSDPVKLRNLKRLIYSLIYMDNGSVVSDSNEDLCWAFDQLNSIFNPYQFKLQQFGTNNEVLACKLPISEKCSPIESELFGLIWNKETDTLSTKKKFLCDKANTKRLVLKTIAANFDPYNFDGPVMNRSRLFLHRLQMDKSLKWDTVIPPNDFKEWVNIARQLNSSKPLVVPRFVGSRDDSYDLIAFCDSSKTLYGTVIYVQSRKNRNVSFLMTKNRMVTTQLDSKSIPALELLGVVLAAETLIDLHHELTGPLCLNPINIDNLYIYSDSLVALSWVRSRFLDLAKMNKQTVFVMNRLDTLEKLTDKHPIIFSFVDGIQNPADYVTRPISHNLLTKTNYLTGPKFLTCSELEKSRADTLLFAVPKRLTSCMVTVVSEFPLVDTSPIVQSSRFSRISRLVGVYEKVLLFVNRLKQRIKPNIVIDENLNSKALRLIIKSEQLMCFPDVVSYFDDVKVKNKDIPNMVTQMNLFMDNSSLIRVGSKMLKRRKFKSDAHCPVLLSKDSHVTKLIIRQTHEKLNHAGIYTVLTYLRKKYWIPHYFSSCKKVLRECVHCRRFNQRGIKLNQSPYRDFRLDPSNVPFSNVFIDHIGPFYTRDSSGVKDKTYLLCITCLFTRAVNLIVSIDLTTTEFLRAFQIHVFSYGMPLKVFSDLGTQIVSGANIITGFLNDPQTHKFFTDNSVSIPSFQQYFKGHSELGSLVESLVKQTKLLIFGAVRNNVLNFREFEFLIHQTVSLLNKRPVAFKECLRSNLGDEVPQPITPERLLFGYDLPAVNVIPYLQPEPEDLDWKPSDDPVDRLRSIFTKLRNVRKSLIEKFNSDFLSGLIYQAVNTKDRYAPSPHTPLKIGDVVLLKENHTKASQFPMAIVKEIVTNDLGETTGAVLLKGSTRETVKRHASCIVLLLRPTDYVDDAEVTPAKPRDSSPVIDNSQVSLPDPRIRRKAFIRGKEKTRKMLKS